MKTLVLASGNPGKLREFREILAKVGWSVVPQADLGVSEVDEPHETFVENALVKARHASRATGLPALADDSGICVPALGGAPGVRSARYAGEPKDDLRNNARLVREVSAVARDEKDWDAFYVAVLVLVRHVDDPLPLIAEGRWNGRLIAEPRGSGGFGYDPHFLCTDVQRTAAEMRSEEKHERSHRGKALAILVDRLADSGIH